MLLCSNNCALEYLSAEFNQLRRSLYLKAANESLLSCTNLLTRLIQLRTMSLRKRRTISRPQIYRLWRDGKTKIPKQTLSNWRKRKALACAAETNFDPIPTADSKAGPATFTPVVAQELDSDLAFESEDLASDSDSESDCSSETQSDIDERTL